MFYLAKFCRVCVKTCVRLIDIETVDSDLLKFSEKLQWICSQMFISEEKNSNRICYDCIQKLRAAYAFQKQCLRSNMIFEQYLRELTSVQPECKFVNSQLRVTIVPVPRANPVTQIEECHNYSQSAASLCDKPVRQRRKLKQEASFRVREKYKRRVHKVSYASLHRLRKHAKNPGTTIQIVNSKLAGNCRLEHAAHTGTLKTYMPKRDIKHQEICKGGLRELLGFIKTYDFGYEIDESHIPNECESSVLDRLESFSRTFFYNDFQEYRDTILSLANDSESCDDDDMFAPYNEEEDRNLWPEFNQLNQNYSRIRVKQEFIDCYKKCQEESKSIEDNVDIKEEPPGLEIQQTDTENEDDGLLPSELVQACYDQPAEVCIEQEKFRQKINLGFHNFVRKIKSSINKKDTLSDPKSIVDNINRISVLPEASTSCSESSLDLLTRLTNSSQLSKTSKTTSLTKEKPENTRKQFTRCHSRCRTKGNPFINPQLMEQFERRNFKCDTCNRSFKSPGYLHSHCTKMGH